MSVVADVLFYAKSVEDIADNEEIGNNETELLETLSDIEGKLRLETRPELRYMYFHARNLVVSVLNKKFQHSMPLVSVLIINKELSRLDRKNKNNKEEEKENG